jgi:D-xylose transport system substrate-binding protein
MKRFLILFLFLFISLILVACSSQATPTPESKEEPTEVVAQEPTVEEGPEHKRFAFLVLQSGAKRYFSADIPNFEEVANAAGYEVVAQSAENDAKTQIDQAESVLTQGIDVLVLQPVNNESAAAIVEMANREGVPVISYNDLVANAPIVAFVGRDPLIGGRVSAEEALKYHPTGNYVLISGESASTVAQDFMTGYKEVLEPAEEAGNVQIVSDQFSPQWATEPAIAQTENALTQNNNDIQVVLTAYDAMAFGVMDALVSAGLEPGVGPDKVFVTGQDVIEGGAQAIAEGRLGGSVWAEFGEMGRLAGETAVAIAEGSEFGYDTTIDNGSGDVPWVQAPIYLVTQENLAEWACSHQWWIPIDVIYQNVPEEQWPTCDE